MSGRKEHQAPCEVRWVECVSLFERRTLLAPWWRRLPCSRLRIPPPGVDHVYLLVGLHAPGLGMRTRMCTPEEVHRHSGGGEGADDLALFLSETSGGPCAVLGVRCGGRTAVQGEFLRDVCRVRPLAGSLAVAMGAGPRAAVTVFDDDYEEIGLVDPVARFPAEAQ